MGHIYIPSSLCRKQWDSYISTSLCRSQWHILTFQLRTYFELSKDMTYEWIRETAGFTMSMYFINCLSLDTKSKAALAIWLIVNRDLLYFIDDTKGLVVRVIALNATFNNISVISWWSVLLMEETGVLGENHWPAISHWQTLSHNVVSSTPRHAFLNNWGFKEQTY